MINYYKYLILLITLLIIIITGGISLIIAFIYVIKIARKNDGKIEKNVVILGKKLINNRADNDFILRLDKAVNGNFNSIYILGGKSNKSLISESSVGRGILINKGINANKIFMENKSQHTLENIKNYHLTQDCNNISLITNRYHMARSLLFAKNFNINASPYFAEKHLNVSIKNLIKMLVEAFFINFYLIGKYIGILTNNKKLLTKTSSQVK